MGLKLVKGGEGGEGGGERKKTTIGERFDRRRVGGII